MGRRVTWSILLLLLTSVQSFALTCNVRCALMATPAKAAITDNSMRGMEHCDSMPSTPSQDEPRVQALQMHSSTICCDDLSFAKDSSPAEQTDIALHSLADASIAEFIILPAPVQKPERPPAYSSTILPSNLIPLVSNLRI